jgi:thiamine biosynthesis lipoprotein
MAVSGPAAYLEAARGDPVRFAFRKMGGIPVSISIWGLSAEQARPLEDAVESRLDALEAKFSSYQVDSLVSRMGRGELRSADDPDLAAVLRIAADVSRRSGGAFDVTVAPLVGLWRKARADEAVPTPEAIETMRARVGAPLLGNDGLDVARLVDAGGAVDLAGIAKGYMADAVVELLRRRGVRRMLVELGGDMVVDNEMDRTLFRVGLRHPLHRGRLLGVLEVANGAVVTSGNYERGFEIAGRRYGHIIDPRSGMPTPDDPLSVTVVADNGALADAWATGLFVLGLEEGSRLAAKEDIEALFVVRGADRGLRIVATPEALDRLQLRERVPVEPVRTP